MNDQTQDQAQPASLNWFTDTETKTAIDGMDFSEQRDLLLALTGSRTWVAILKFLKERRDVVREALVVHDPVKDPTSIARCQGMMVGLVDLPGILSQVVMEAREKEAQKTTVNPAPTIII